MAENHVGFESGDALVIIDVQNDFCPGGAAPVAQGDRIVPVLNRFIGAADAAGIPVYASRDWHPPGHVSFQERGGTWPPHCLQDSPGAGFHPDLELPESVVKITKGARLDQDQVSAFDQTGLTQELRQQRVRRLWVGGLALETCVFSTMVAARKEGFEAVLIEDGTLPFSPEAGERARRLMRGPGVRFASLA